VPLKKYQDLKINFHKSELFCYGQAKEMEIQYTKFFGCDLGQYLFRYVGIPMNHMKLGNDDWKVIEDTFEKRISCWKGKLLSYGGRLVLINSILRSHKISIMKGILHKLDYYRSMFF
jgi:hypothetical protein